MTISKSRVLVTLVTAGLLLSSVLCIPSSILRPNRPAGDRTLAADSPTSSVEITEDCRGANLLKAHATDASTQPAAEHHESPISFEENVGQFARPVKFFSGGTDYGLFLTPNEAIFGLRHCGQTATHRQDNLCGPPAAAREPHESQPADIPDVVRMRLVGSNASPIVSGLNLLAGRSNYLIGDDPAAWRVGVPNYERVLYKAVYPGIDVVYHSAGRSLEYDFLVSAGANPRAITLDFEGIEGSTVDPNGNLMLATRSGELVQHKPLVYQEAGNVRTEIAGGYAIAADGLVHFELSDYDSAMPLVIDPALTYSTLVGGDGSEAFAGTVDASGSAYITGHAVLGLPITPGAYQASGVGVAFVTKLNPEGSAVVYSTYIGGVRGISTGYGIAVDGDGNAYITGQAIVDFPTTPGAFQTTLKGYSNAFVAKLNPGGTGLIYSTLLGGSRSCCEAYINDDMGNSIAVDPAGNAYITGKAVSTDFPVTQGAFQTSYGGNLGDAFVTKLDRTGSHLSYSTFLGGSKVDIGNGIAVSPAGNAFVTGVTYSSDFPTTPGTFHRKGGVFVYNDVFITEMTADGSNVEYSTHFGGTYASGGAAIAIDTGGNAYVTGTAFGDGFPTTPGAFQFSGWPWQNTFVVKVDTQGKLAYSTYLVGHSLPAGTIEMGNGLAIAVRSSGHAYVAGWTTFSDFPSIGAALPTAHGRDCFLVKLNADGTALDYSSRFGGGDDYAYGIAVDSSARVYLIGYTVAQSFPATPGAYQTTKTGNSTNMFVASIDLGPKITGATIDGKNLIVSGENFEEGAVIVLDGQDQRTLSSDQNPTGLLTGKKTAKRIAPGQMVNLQVRNPDGVLSPVIPFQRPSL